MQNPHSLAAESAERLRALIRDGAFENERLSSEPVIAEMLGVSRTTARQALAELAQEGMIIRKRGRGTFVNRHVLQIPSRLEEVWDFDEMIRLSGHAPSVRHVETQFGVADPNLQARLGLGPGDEMVSVTNVFLADGRPVIFCRDIIPGRIVRQAYAPEELHGPVYAFLERRCQQRVVYNITEIAPVTADAALARHLSCPPGAPLHYFDEVGYNFDHQAILYSQEYYLPRAFSFKLVRKLITQRLSKAGS